MRARSCTRFGRLLLALGLVSGVAGCGGSTSPSAGDPLVMSLLNTR